MRQETPRKRRSMVTLSLIVPLVVYVGFAGRFIAAHVGYEMDEAIYVESAVYVLRGSAPPPFRYDSASWLSTHGRRWPAMIIPYVGTTKAFAALPLFAIFGISASVARFSGVLFGAVGIAGLITLLGSEIGPLAGLILGISLAVHPSYLDLTVFDNGGASVWMASLGLVSLGLANFLRRRSTRSAFLLGVAGGLGLWARLNFLWLLASLVAAALLVLGKRAIPPRRQLFAMIGGGFAGALPLFVYEAGSRLATLQYVQSTRQPLSLQTVSQRLRELAEVMISDGEQRGIWAGPSLPAWEIGLGAILLGAILVSLFLPVSRERAVISRWRRAFAVSVFVLSAFLLISGLGVRQHHLVGVLPLALATLVIVVFELGKRSRASVPFFLALAAGLLALWVAWDMRIDRGLRRTQGRGIWSSAIDDVCRYLQSHPIAPGRLKILNWGFQSNLYVGSGGAVHGSELFWEATQERSSRGTTWPEEIRDGGSFLLFFFPTGGPSLDAAAQGFSTALQEYRGPRQERLFGDRSGLPVALLIEIDPAAAPR